MCGRYELNIAPARMEKLFSLRHPPGEITTRYNVAPGQVLLICDLDKEGERQLASSSSGCTSLTIG